RNERDDARQVRRPNAGSRQFVEERPVHRMEFLQVPFRGVFSVQVDTEPMATSATDPARGVAPGDGSPDLKDFPVLVSHLHSDLTTDSWRSKRSKINAVPADVVRQRVGAFEGP